MSRLPVPGSDKGTWGGILNDFLLASHEANGTLKQGSVGASQLADNAITETQLATAVRTSLGKADGSLQSANNLSELTSSASNARGNLGLGGAATLNVGTGTGTVAAGDDTRFNTSSALSITAVAASVTSSGALVVGRHNPVDTTSGSLTMTLPTGQTVGAKLSIEKTDNTVNTVTVSGNIRGVGSSSIVLYWQHETLEFIVDGSGSYWPIAGHKTKSTLDTAYKRPATLATMPGSFAPAGARLSWYRNTQVTNMIGGTQRIFVPVPNSTQDTFLPVFANLFGEESIGANALTIACSIEATDSNGTNRTAYTFGGNHTVVLQPGGVIVPDRAITVPQTTTNYATGAGSGTVSGVWLYVYVVVASGQAIPLNVGLGLSNSEIDGLSSTGGADYTLPGSGSAVSGNNANGWTFGPVALLGTAKDVRMFGAIGDSLLQGHGDTPDYIGYMNRASISSGIPVLNVAVSGERAFDFAKAQLRARRTAELNGVTDLFIDLGVNDLATGRTIAQLKADLTIIFNWATNLGIRVHALTITPETSSTDSWATTVNQAAIISAANLSSINTWLRGLPAGIYACYDIATLVSTSQDSGIWKAGYTADGIHPNASTHQTILAPALATYVSNYKSSGSWNQ
ncbi:MAG: hydrolase family protein [Candidatus Saccharibacteria bacterium]|nr:hydrolase family protein [Candidatus Saccharibacteria bacterium]